MGEQDADPDLGASCLFFSLIYHLLATSTGSTRRDLENSKPPFRATIVLRLIGRGEVTFYLVLVADLLKFTLELRPSIRTNDLHTTFIPNVG